MPRGPQGQKRPADVIGCAIMVARIATGELEPDARMPGRMRSGKAGGGSQRRKTFKGEAFCDCKKSSFSALEIRGDRHEQH